MLCLISILVIFFYSSRPFIVEHQTNTAIAKLERHLREMYPEDIWRIADTDEHEIHSVIYLHVIFGSEPEVVYEYSVKETEIEQVDMWMLSGHSVSDSGIKPQHVE